MAILREFRVLWLSRLFRWYLKNSPRYPLQRSLTQQCPLQSFFGKIIPVWNEIVKHIDPSTSTMKLRNLISSLSDSQLVGTSQNPWLTYSLVRN
ncbi:unnamed protein product [Caenorhabditis angaria]|uniref:Uncharacterized protein n=1 Tax=Caenorhabditis angaria TaxID=860376 RepID=A0A9P1I690_9PELO|nr:unnamed protein product [Caenorhabditis angaria]